MSPVHARLLQVLEFLRLPPGSALSLPLRNLLPKYQKKAVLLSVVCREEGAKAVSGGLLAKQVFTLLSGSRSPALAVAVLLMRFPSRMFASMRESTEVSLPSLFLNLEPF